MTERVLVGLTKGERSMILTALRARPEGFAKDIATRLEQTRCPSCGGDGFAPYVGGNDDEASCLTCHGTGFKLNPLP